ncbi:hypothetical protein Q1695_016018 [Nippostrongylus brasiliensis]|nr:hypothetical protein Q1695_016018 [Nippostrongylus brasiliensis]
MHLHLRHLGGTDSKGRVYVSLDDMAEIYRNFHAALNATYWETASNHKICTDAMEMLKTTHISKKNGRFLFLFTSVLSEAYSHAHYNVQELLYDDRDIIRANYWSDVLVLYKAVMTKAEKVYSHSKCAQPLSILLHFASLFSLYKDVADEDFITSLYQTAESYIVNDKHRLNDAELEQVKEYYNAIETIYHLRAERRHGSRQDRSLQVPDEPPTLRIEVDDTTEDMQQILGLRDMPTPRHKLRPVNQPRKTERSDIDRDHKTNEHTQHSNESSKENGDHESHSQKELLQERVRSDLTTGEPVTSKESSHLSVDGDKATESTQTTEDFDFREEFDRRFREKKGLNCRTDRPKLPVIGRHNKDDVVQSYRRRGLFDSVNYPPQSSIPVLPVDQAEGGGPAVKTHTVSAFDEIDLVKKVAAKEEEELNNNTLIQPLEEKLAENPVSPVG